MANTYAEGGTILLVSRGMFQEMLSDLKLGHKAFLLVAIPLAFELLFVCVLYRQIEDTEKQLASANQSRAIVAKLNTLMMTILDISITHRSGNKSGKAKSRSIYDTINAEMRALEKECAGRAKDTRLVREVRMAFEDGMLEVLDAKKRLRDNYKQLLLNAAGATPVELRSRRRQVRSSTLQPTFGKIIEVLNKVKKEHEIIQEKSALAVSKKRQEILKLLMAGSACNCLIAVLLVAVFNRSIVGRLNRLMTNTKKLAREEELDPPIGGRDEIGHLDRTFYDVAQSLLLASARQRAIFQDVADVICLLDFEGRFLEASKSSESVWGYDLSELREMTVFDLVVASEVTGARDAFSQTASSNDSTSFECSMRSRSGPIVSVLWSISWSDSEEGYFCVAHDITEKKNFEEWLVQAEARLRVIVERLPLGLVIANVHGIIKALNPVAEQLLACKADDVFDKHIETIFQCSRDEIARAVELSHEKPHEVMAVRPGGANFPAEISSSTVETGEGTRVLIVVVDITERHQIEQMKQQFVAMVSHELKTPISAVQNYFEFLDEGVYGELTAKGKTRLPQVQQNLSRLMNLIRDLMQVQKLEARAITLEIEEIELQDVVDLAIENVRSLAHKKEITLKVDETPLFIRADQDRLIQVLVNLCANAVKFAPEQSEIEVRVEQMANGFKLLVSDQGCGVEQSDQERIFKKYEQVSGADAGNHGGVGLGLAICREIVELHGGTIGVESDDSDGSTFWFEIPDCVASSVQ